MSTAVNAIARVGINRVGINLIDETTLTSSDRGVGQGRTNGAEGDEPAAHVNSGSTPSSTTYLACSLSSISHHGTWDGPTRTLSQVEMRQH
jgi:hypothetical protein